MTNQLEDVFSPGRGIEIAFNINSLSPTVRSSIIFEADHSEKTFIIAQPTPPLLKSMALDEMSLTTTVKGGASKLDRVGVSCKITSFTNNYKLAGNKTTAAVELKYTPPLFEGNIRSAYRHTLNQGFNAGGVIRFNNEPYISGKDFKIFDISITGAGLLIPRVLKKKRNPLFNVEPGTQAIISLLLINTTKEGEVKKETLMAKASVIRLNQNYNELCGYMGLKLNAMTSQNENILSSFVHEAQLYELRSISGI